MDRTSELLIKNGKKWFKTYLNPSTGNMGFEVKDHDDILYNGESFEQATTLYEGLCQYQDGR
jgi:hypothetical protein